MNECNLIGFIIGVAMYATIAFVLSMWRARNGERQYAKDQIYAEIGRLEQRIMKLEAN